MPPLDFLLVPGAVGRTSAELWVGTTDLSAPSRRVVVEHSRSARRWPIAGWQYWEGPDARAALCFARLELTGLAAATPYALTLRVDGNICTSADVTTLPAQLPRLTEPAFTILIGSCFSAGQDGSGAVGQTFIQLPGGLKPQLKLLVGDQVYLDSPWYRFLAPQSEARLAAGFFKQYWHTWAQHADRQGFHLLLRAGANYFCADDHEFWNNAPFASSFVVNTWSERGRDAWWSLARSLYSVFQTTRTWVTFDIGDFSVCVVDTRLHRTRDRRQFLLPEDLRRLEDWVTNLAGPALLALSQPIFAPHAPHGGRFADWTVADFDQYRDVCRILLSSRHSIVVASGDLHFGRIARAALPSGAELVEVVASPMSLVDPLAQGTWSAAPAQFPAAPIPGLKAVRVTTDTTWRISDNHFVTMEMHRGGDGVRCRVRAWGTTGGAVPAPTEFVLRRGTR
jgi:hypothetical protein